MQKVTPFLTFKESGEEAVNLYVSLIKNSRVIHIVRSQAPGPIPEGALQYALFELDGRELMAMDGGSHFRFEEGFSLYVNCETQEEIDRLWDVLSEGGEEQPCGWLKDRFGVSWQIIHPVLGAYLTDPDTEKSQRVMEAMLKMKKIDIALLQQAYGQ
jgi:predicted 3-demethylubiquinone-9 3-methyltransferase (glyoxalase superfamily)